MIKQDERDELKESYKYLLVMLGMVISYSSLIRFPGLFYENSSAFLVAYFIVLILIGVPVYHLESTFG